MNRGAASAAAAALSLSVCGLAASGAAAGQSHAASARNGSSITVAPPPAAARTRGVIALQRSLSHDINGYGGTNSALVIDESTGRTLWSYDPAVWRLPASVEKLYTTSTALADFGPKAVFRTRVYGVGTLLADGTFKGNIYLKGGGDPTFGASRFDRIWYGTGATAQTLVARLRGAGVRRVDGRIIADASLFDALHGGPATDYRANLETEGSLSALAYDSGYTNIYGTALQSRPALYAAQQFTATMRDMGITVPARTPVTTGTTPRDARQLASVASPDLARLLQMTNSPSDNFFAEMLLKQLGARFGGRGSTAAGAAVVRRQVAARFGLHPQLNDGSGLSRYDHTTTEQVVYLLRRMQSNPSFWNSLAIAGVRGTMQSEMLHTRAVNNCRGKTGTLHDVANMVGYCTAANGNKIVFAFLMNGLTDPGGGHQLEDDAGVALADFRG